MSRAVSVLAGTPCDLHAAAPTSADAGEVAVAAGVRCSMQRVLPLPCIATLLTRPVLYLPNLAAGKAPEVQLSLVSRGSASTPPFHSDRSPLGYNKPRVAHVAAARHWRASNYPRVNFRMTSAEGSLDFQPRGDVLFPFCIKNEHIVSIPPPPVHSHAASHTSFGARGPPVCLGSSLASFEPFRCLDCQRHTLLQGTPTTTRVQHAPALLA